MVATAVTAADGIATPVCALAPAVRTPISTTKAADGVAEEHGEQARPVDSLSLSFMASTQTSSAAYVHLCKCVHIMNERCSEDYCRLSDLLRQSQTATRSPASAH
jgi:hypothetical protein